MNRQVSYLEDFAEACCHFCDKHVSWLLIGFSIVYFLMTGWLASQKMLWNDELFTFYIAKLNSHSDIVAAVSTGADQQPPSFYFLTHSVFTFLGASEVTVRLPEVCGFWLTSLCLFRFVSRRLPPLYGFAAMLFPLVTTAYEYAYEARPYGLVLGFASLALLCWQGAAEGTKRLWWLLGLTASGAAAISCHYYAVFLVVPLGLGEIVRSVAQRRIDVPVWVALGCALVPLLWFLPFLQHARTYASHFWAQPQWGMIPGFYYFLLLPTLGPLVATFIVSSLLTAEKNLQQPSYQTIRQLPWHETAAALGFVVIPVIAVIIAKFVTGAFTHRYALVAVIGFSILCATSVYRLNCGRAIMGVCFTLFLGIWFIVLAMIQMKQHTTTSASWAKTYTFLQSKGNPQLPIVVADLHSFMTLTYYAPRALSSRFVYLADAQASIRYLGHDTVDRGILDLRPWFPVPVEEYKRYLVAHKHFFVYAQGVRSGDLNWLLFELRNAPVQLELKERNGDFLLFLATVDEHEDGAEVQPDEGAAQPMSYQMRQPS